MKNNIFKRTALAIALTTSVFAGSSYAAMTSFESDYTNQIHGLQPIIESIGAVIFKKNASVPYAAAENGGIKADPQVGDTLYVPANILESIKAQYPNAYSDAIYTFGDWDGDKEDGQGIAATVEWYVLEKTDTSFDGKEPVLTTPNTYGVPYIIQPEDVGKKIGFRITPKTIYGLPVLGQPLDVIDISKLYGQEYPDTDGDGNPDVDDKGNPLPPVVKGPSTDPEDDKNPNIGTEIVQVGDQLYEVRVVNAQGEFMDGKSTSFVPYVNSTYRAQVFKITEKDGVKGYEDVSNNPEIKNNIVWKLNTVAKAGEPNSGHNVVVNTGLSNDAFVTGTDTVASLQQDIKFKQRIDPTANITGRVGGVDEKGNFVENNGTETSTLAFTTQVKNENALYKEAPNYSEQGLQIKAVLVAEAPAQP